MHFWSLKHTNFVWLEALKTPQASNPINIFDKPKYYFILFSIIKYWWILRIYSFLIELWSTEKLNTVPFKEVPLCSSFVKSFDVLPKQKLY